ncbi:MAG: hydroxyacid dehydrogenase, partial [Halanaerobiaceae bacterium]
MNNNKNKILMIIKENLYDLIFSHIEEKFKKEFDLIKIYQEDFKSKKTIKKLSDLKEVKGYVGSWGSPELDQELLKLLPKLEIVALAKGSVKGYICKEAFKKGIVATSAHMALAPSVAETTLMLTLMGLKLYKKQRKRMEHGKRRAPNPVGYELINKTVGLIGYGRIARRFRKLLQSFDTDILVYDPYLNQENIAEEDIKLVSLDELIIKSDIISLHAPGTEDNESLIDAEALSQMKDDALLVNTARGILIDERALYEELKTGRIRAALDVFRTEPLPLDSPLRELDNVVLTPHIGGFTYDSRKHAGELVFNELKRYFNNQELKYKAVPE